MSEAAGGQQVSCVIAGVPRVSAAVMTHPSRLPLARELRDQHAELGFRIVVDTGSARGSTLATARRARGTLAPDATHLAHRARAWAGAS